MGERLNKINEIAPRTQLHDLIREMYRAYKLSNMGDPNDSEAKYKKLEKEVEEFLKKHPELKSEVDKIKDHFDKKFYS